MKMRVLTAAVLATLASSAAWAASEGGDTLSNYGTPVQSQKVDETVHLRPDSRWVNVNYGETVRFVAQGSDGSQHSFAWRFNVASDVFSVDLGKVAPVGFPDRQVRVYVGPDPSYLRG
jgi:hypothetical protein